MQLYVCCTFRKISQIFFVFGDKTQEGCRVMGKIISTAILFYNLIAVNKQDFFVRSELLFLIQQDVYYALQPMNMD